VDGGVWSFQCNTGEEFIHSGHRLCAQVSMKNFHVTMKDVTPAGLARGLEQIQKVSFSWLYSSFFLSDGHDAQHAVDFIRAEKC
jgi:hypothetical protein